jgi:predicted nucleic-acid-binding protein
MLGVDTNVLLRYVVEDDPEQTRQAEAWLQEAETEGVFVSHLVLAEMEWVLAKGYRFGRPDIHRTFDDLLKTRHVTIPRRDEVEKGLEAYRTGKADLSDYLLVEAARAAGCTRFATFDKDLKAGLGDLAPIE